MKKILIEELIKPTSTSNVNVGKITSIEKSIFDDIDSSASASKVKVNLLGSTLSGMSVSLGFTPISNDKTEIGALVDTFANTISSKGYKKDNLPKGYVWKKGQDNSVSFVIYNNTTGVNIDLSKITTGASSELNPDAAALKIMTAAASKAMPGVMSESINYEIIRIKNLMSL
jgi:hypothetical protein